jgi:hypothetical protein
MDAMLLLLHLAKGNWSFCLSVICHQTSKPLMDQILHELQQKIKQYSVEPVMYM